MAPTNGSILATESWDIADFVINTGHGVKGLAEMGLKSLQKQFHQPLQERLSEKKILGQVSIPFINKLKWESPEVAKSICDAAESWGFFQIVNHGVPLTLAATWRIFNGFWLSFYLFMILGHLGACLRRKKAFHDIFYPFGYEKRKYSKENSPTNNVRFGSSFVRHVERALDWKDSLSLFYVSEEETAAFWPPVCKDEMLEYRKSSEVLIKRLMHVLVKGLNVKRIDEIRALMLLDALQIIRNGRYKSFEHYVIGNGSQNRISVPLFVNLKPEAILCPFPKVLANGEKPLYKPVLCADYSRHFYTKAHVGNKTIDFAKISNVCDENM
ncbi:hypothetical protein CISIN_1g040217mg [Citrus sinensis]|uniref:Non-haem dioxygenase N-terminal domain-containing protein n=1 Tax=Citrus sinensis TaxID=2711 RepID=A0A067FHW2_CITSI|nr:hypothetical protein CISIN_1g040217mg [Citrus sinensis]